MELDLDNEVISIVALTTSTTRTMTGYGVSLAMMKMEAIAIVWAFVSKSTNDDSVPLTKGK